MLSSRSNSVSPVRPVRGRTPLSVKSSNTSGSKSRSASPLKNTLIYSNSTKMDSDDSIAVASVPALTPKRHSPDKIYSTSPLKRSRRQSFNLLHQSSPSRQLNLQQSSILPNTKKGSEPTSSGLPFKIFEDPTDYRSQLLSNLQSKLNGELHLDPENKENRTSKKHLDSKLKYRQSQSHKRQKLSDLNILEYPGYAQHAQLTPDQSPQHPHKERPFSSSSAISMVSNSAMLPSSADLMSVSTTEAVGVLGTKIQLKNSWMIKFPNNTNTNIASSKLIKIPSYITPPRSHKHTKSTSSSSDSSKQVLAGLAQSPSLRNKTSNVRYKYINSLESESGFGNINNAFEVSEDALRRSYSDDDLSEVVGAGARKRLEFTVFDDLLDGAK